MSSPSQFDAPAPEALEALLPAYAFEMLIAQGGMGAVYKARQKSLDRDVAIKILPRELVADPVFRKSFETEARAMARLNHPNLISIYDSGEVDGMPYLVMEFVPGKSLQRSTTGRVIEPTQAVELAIGICNGLAHAHDSGILHHDLKPANILLNQKAEPKIGDFGLAHADANAAGGSRATVYTAPEAVREPEKGDRRADLYAVGVILHEMLTGMAQQPGGEPPSTAKGVDAALDAIWRRATNSNPGLRYPDAHAFAADLKGWMSDRAGGRGAASPPTTSSLSRKPGPPARVPVPRQEELVIAPPRSGGGGTFVNLLLIAALLGGGYYAWKKMSAPKDDTPAETSEDAATTATGGTAPAAGGSSKLPLPSNTTVNPPRNSDSPFGSSSPFGSTSPGGASSGHTIPGPGPADRTSGTTSGKADGSSDALTVKARELITTAEADRTKALAENVKNLNWNLDTWVHGLPKNEQTLWQIHVDGYKAIQHNSRVPLSVPADASVKLSPQMGKLASAAADKQKEIDANYLAKVTKYHDLYVSKMKDAIAVSEKGGQESTARNQRLLLGEATSLNGWVTGLGGTVQPDNPSLEPHTRLDTSDKSSFFGIPLK